MPDTYPTGTDLQVFLVSASLISNPPTPAQGFMDYHSAMLAAVDEFERLTGYTPFLSDGTSTPRTFDGPGSPILPLNAGLLSLTSLTINTTPYTQNQQFVLSPPDAANNRRPYTYLDFGSGWGGSAGNVGDWGFGFGVGSQVGLGTLGTGRRSIVVTGVWGYSLTLPFDVKRALLHRGAVELAPDLMHAVSAGVSQRTEGDETVKYSAKLFGEQMAEWRANFNETATRYRLFSM